MTDQHPPSWPTPPPGPPSGAGWHPAPTPPPPPRPPTRNGFPAWTLPVVALVSLVVGALLGGAVVASRDDGDERGGGETTTTTEADGERGGGGDGTTTTTEAEPDPAGETYEAGSYTFTDVVVEADAIDDFEVRAQVTNEGNSRVSAAWTVSILSDGSEIASASGSEQDFDPGDTVEVTFITADDFTDDWDDVEFTVDYEY